MIVIIDLDRQLLSGDGWWFIIRMIVLIFARLTIEINSTITTSFCLSVFNQENNIYFRDYISFIRFQLLFHFYKISRF